MSLQYSVILPTLNERDNILQLLDSLLGIAGHPPAEVIVVDDDSEDGTAELVTEKFFKDSRVRVINRKGRKRGLVPSLNEGIANAKTEFVLWMDADLQMPVTQVSEFIDTMLLKDVTAVVGSRYLPGGGDHRSPLGADDVTVVHRMLSSVLSRFVPFVLGFPFTDVTSGFILARRDFFFEYQLQGNHGEYFIYLLSKFSRRKASVAEIPYILQHRQAGASKTTRGSFISMSISGLGYLRTVLGLFLNRFR